MPASAEGQSRALRVAWWAAAGLTLGLLPFESRFLLTHVAGVAITPLHLAFAAMIGVWLATLVVERRLPAIPTSLVVALAFGVVVAFLSALLATNFNDEAFRFAAITSGGWLLFVVLVDMVRAERDATFLSSVLVATCTGAAVLGIVLLALPAEVTVNLLGQDHTVAGARRLQATFGYPNTAAVAFEAAVFVAAGLLGVFRERLPRLLIGLAIVFLVLATALTLSRGAVLGLLAGSVTLVGVAWFAGRRRLAARATAAGAVALLAFLAVQLVALPIERLWTDSESDFYGATYDAPEHIAASYDHPRDVTVTVTNTGNAGWLAGRYRLGYHWLNSVDHGIIEFGHVGAELGDVPAGGSADVAVPITRPQARPVLLAWDIQQVGGEWFSERGVPVATSEVGSDVPPYHPPHLQTLLLYPALLPEPSRSELWGAAVAMVRDAPLLGVGPGTYRLRYGTYLGWPEWDERIHSNNTYLEIGATTGIAGLAVFLFVSLYAIWRQLRNLATRPATRGWLLSAGIAAAAVAFAAHGVVDYFLGFTGTQGIYWAILGIGLGLALRERRGAEPA
ncbi:MAG TPA: O-antigen ligase family protein [Candidatus Limnocylindrales bacterium]|nr:O-antigen ligase family protein [Candidatus Limnocylindrales bacterium]